MCSKYYYVADALHTLGVSKIELLQAHNLGHNKNMRLQRVVKDYSVDIVGMEKFIVENEKRDIKANTLLI